MRNNRHYLYPALAALLAAGITTACVDESSPSMPGSSDSHKAIRFAPNTEKSTRASDITTNSLNTFKVYGYTGGTAAPTVYMNNVTVQKGENNVWTYSPLQYWPTQPVDFYAFWPESLVGTGGTPLSTATYNNYPNTRDMIYAVSLDNSGYDDSINAQVALNFKHAMSKVGFNVGTTNADVTIEISSITLTNIKTQGNFKFPDKNTAPGEQGGAGTWTNLSSPSLYIMYMAQTLDERIALTNTPRAFNSTIFGDEELYLLPQQLNWRSHGGGTDTFLTIVGSIYDTDTKQRLWPNADTPDENLTHNTLGDGVMRLPLSTSQFTAWEPGYHYIYNITINSNPDMGTIEFGAPTVDTYVKVTSNFD